MRVWRCGIGLVILFLFGRLSIAEVGRSDVSASCPARSVSDWVLGFQDSVCLAGDEDQLHRVSVVEGGEVSLQKALGMLQNDSHAYVAVLFHASWCPFSKALRPSFSALASLYPSIFHLAIEESSVRPSILSKHGVHGFPSLFLFNSTMRIRYHGSRTLGSLASFYSDATGMKSNYPVEEAAAHRVGCLSNYERSEDEENCPFSWARSPELFLKQETCLALASVFVILRLLYFLSPYMLRFAHCAWRRHMQNARLGRLWDHLLAYLNGAISLLKSLKEPPCKRRRNLQGGALTARTWASKSLASAVSIGDAGSSSSRVNLDS